MIMMVTVIYILNKNIRVDIGFYKDYINKLGIYKCFYIDDTLFYGSKPKPEGQPEGTHRTMVHTGRHTPEVYAVRQNFVSHC